MKEITLNNDGILGMGENPSVRTQGMVRSGWLSWAKRVIRGLIDSFNTPFQSDWEKKTGLNWKEWGKLS